MMLPRIHTLSTVGVIKHYVRDYPFHSLRTDFIGENGTGKSIIADLLQLIFIHDAKLIEFGTDSINPEERDVHTLPHVSTSIAYCFITVEVEDGRFMVLGVAISRRESIPVTPFMVLKSSDINADYSESTFSKGELLLARDFITDKNTIPEPKALALNLRNRNIHFIHFATKERRNDYYGFLYRSEILPINLSHPESQKAFAKVLQSFSKAKTLNLAVSKSIKEFLFDESDDEFAGEYESGQAELKKLMNAYQSLSDFIADVTKKQSRLSALKEHEAEMLSAARQYKIAVIAFAERDFKQLNEEAKTVEEQIDAEKLQAALLHKNSNRLPKVKEWARVSADKAEESLKTIEAWNSKTILQTDLAAAAAMLKALPKLSLDGLDAKGEFSTDYESYTAAQIKDTVVFAQPFIERYGSLSAIDAKSKKQTEVLSQALMDTKRAQDEISGLIQILEGGAPDTLLAWVLEKGIKLTAEQEAIVLSFKDALVRRPSLPTEGQRYASQPNALLNADFQKSNDDGGWLSVGVVEQFIKSIQGGRLFDSSDNSNTSLESRLSELLNESSQLRTKEEAITNALRGVIQPAFCTLGFAFDEALLDNQNAARIKTGVYCCSIIPQKIAGIEKELLEINSWLKHFGEEHSIGNRISDAALLERALEQRKERRRALALKLSALEGSVSVQMTNNESQLSKLRNDYNKLSSELVKKQEYIDNLRAEYHTAFGENVHLDDFILEGKDLEHYKAEADDAKVKHALYYRETASRFEETADDRDLGVALQISEATYGFTEMERALLGHIAHTDKIEAALSNANNDRHKLIDSIQGDVAKVFKKTAQLYKKYDTAVKLINAFFATRKISGQFYFKINFAEHPLYKISFLEDFKERISAAHRAGELQFNLPVGEQIEALFAQIASLREKVAVQKLLNPKTYFELSVSLKDEFGESIPGSTGEAYSAIALLGIARLSKIDQSQRGGLRFLILEEVSSLDSVNFSTFPQLAQEYGYQIITMSPQPYGTNLSEEWYMHHLNRGVIDKNINHPPLSYYYTKSTTESLPPLS